MRGRQEEITVAKWLFNAFGGDVILRKEIKSHGVHTTDCFWNGQPWELKTIHSNKAASLAIRQALIQLEEKDGGIILDCAYHLKKFEELMKFINLRMK